MSNEIKFGNFTFTDEQITSAKIHQEQSPLCDTLDADTLTFVVQSNSLGDGSLYTVINELFQPSDYDEFVIEDMDILDYKYAEPVYYRKDGVLIGKFFITEIDRLSEDRFTVSATSAIGLLVRQKYVGGVYAGVSASELINDIMRGTNITCEIETSVANTTINGYLPYGYKREALQMILNAIGANVLKDATTGRLRFVYNIPTTSKVVPDSRMYVGGSNQITSPITKVTVTEHTYYQNPESKSEIIYTHSGVSANHSLVVLDEPIVPTSITQESGITIHNSGANFVEFSGIGNIYAIKYTHVSSIVSWENPDTTLEEHPCNISSNTLITALNSANVLARFKKYYTQAKQTDCSIVLANEKPGDYISYTDPFGDEATGFIKSMDIGVSNIDKADTKLITNWYPSESGNNFNGYQLIQTTGTVTVPTAARGKPGRLILLGGFQGGQGGTAGLPGTNATEGDIEGSGSDRWQWYEPGVGGEHGGKNGVGGNGCKVYTVNISSLPNSFQVTSIGAGGAGSPAVAYGQTANYGSEGGATTVTINGTAYSSDSGAKDVVGFINFIDGTYYIIPGANGHDNTNSKGGDGSKYTGGSESGSSITVDGTTWIGGKAGKNGGACIGGAGGSAAYGKNGTDGGDGEYSSRTRTGSGGSGATPVTPSKANFPYGGQGGHGGGAGGGAGGGRVYYGRGVTKGVGGAAGAGSPGGQGSDGAVIFYYGT